MPQQRVALQSLPRKGSPPLRIAIFLLLCNVQLDASTIYTWTSASSQSWRAGGNWTPTGPPTSNNTVHVGTGTQKTADDNIDSLTGMTVIVDSGYTAQVGATSAVSLSISGGSNAGTISVTWSSAALTLAGPFTNSGTLSNTAGGHGYINSTLTNTSGTIIGNWSSMGTISGGTISSGIVLGGAYSGTIQLNDTTLENGTNAGAIQATASGGTWSGGTNNGSLQSHGNTLTLLGTVNNNGSVDATGGGNLNIGDGTTVTTLIGGNLSGNIGLNNGGSVTNATINAGGTVSVLNGVGAWNGGTNNGTLQGGGGNLVITGSLANANGVIDPALGASVTIGDGSTPTIVSGGAFSGSGALNMNQATADGVNNSKNLSVVGGADILNASVNTGTITLAGGSLSVTGGLNNTGGSLNGTKANLTIASGITVTGGSINGATADGATLGGVSFSNLNMSTGVLANSATVSGGANSIKNVSIAGTLVTVTGGTSVFSNLTDGNGSLVTVAGGATTLSGAFANAGGTPGAYSQTGGNLVIGDATFNGQSLSQTGGTLTIAGPVDPLGVYTLNGGTLNLDDLFTVGTATLSAGTVVDGGGQIVANSLYDAVALDESEIAGGTNLANTPLDSLTLAGGTLSVAPPPSGTPSGIGNEIVNPHEVYVQTSLILGGFLDLTSLTLTNSYPQAGLSPEPYLFPIFETGPAGVSGMFSEVCDASNACYTVTSLSNGAWQIGSFDGWGIRVRPIQFTPGVNGEEVLLVDRTPEPATYLIGGGILGLALLRRRRRG